MLSCTITVYFTMLLLSSVPLWIPAISSICFSKSRHLGTWKSRKHKQVSNFCLPVHLPDTSKLIISFEWGIEFYFNIGQISRITCFLATKNIWIEAIYVIVNKKQDRKLTLMKYCMLLQLTLYNLLDRTLMCKGSKGLLTKIVEVMKKEPTTSTFRFWLARAVESYLRGSTSYCDQIFLMRRGLLQVSKTTLIFRRRRSDFG